MEVALWTGVLVLLPAACFLVQGRAVRWFLEGEPPRALQPVVDRVTPVYRRLVDAARRSRFPRCCCAWSSVASMPRSVASRRGTHPTGRCG